MATIEVGGNPSAYEHIRGGVISSGPDWYDDRFDDGSGKTEVVASARVFNTEGTANGRAYIEVTNNTTRTKTPGSPRTIPAGGYTDVGITYSVSDNAVANLTIRVMDEATEFMLPGAERSFTVNSYEELREAALTSGGISITVV